MNFVLKVQIQSLVESMRIVSKTEEKIFQMIGVTFMQFFNTAIILFLLSLDFEKFEVRHEWYSSQCGALIFAMVFTAIFPLIDLTVIVGIIRTLRWADRGFTSNKFVSYLPSIQTYIDLHSGPDFAIQWRYGSILF